MQTVEIILVEKISTELFKWQKMLIELSCEKYWSNKWILSSKFKFKFILICSIWVLSFNSDC